jgi:hypothetical protein
MSEKHKKKIPVIHRPKTAEDKDLTHITEAMGRHIKDYYPEKTEGSQKKKRRKFPETYIRIIWDFNSRQFRAEIPAYKDWVAYGYPEEDALKKLKLLRRKKIMQRIRNAVQTCKTATQLTSHRQNENKKQR